MTSDGTSVYATTELNLCKQGHDKAAAGITKWGHCRACKREKDRNRKPYRMVKDFCVAGHDKRVVGVRTNNACAECHRERNRGWSRARTEKNRQANRNHRANGREIPKLGPLRKELGLTQRQLSEASGVSLFVVQNIERGKCRATPPVLRALLGTISRLMRERKEERWGS